MAGAEKEKYGKRMRGSQAIGACIAILLFFGAANAQTQKTTNAIEIANRFIGTPPGLATPAIPWPRNSVLNPRDLLETVCNSLHILGNFAGRGRCSPRLARTLYACPDCLQQLLNWQILARFPRRYANRIVNR